MTLVQNIFTANESITHVHAIHLRWGLGGALDVSEERNNAEKGSNEKGKSAALKSCGRSLEITGLGVVASLIVSFGSLVMDGTLPLDQYLVFLSLMLVGAGALIWRIWNLVPDGRTIRKEDERVQPGEYRIVFK